MYKQMLTDNISLLLKTIPSANAIKTATQCVGSFILKNIIKICY